MAAENQAFVWGVSALGRDPHAVVLDQCGRPGSDSWCSRARLPLRLIAALQVMLACDCEQREQSSRVLVGIDPNAVLRA